MKKQEANKTPNRRLLPPSTHMKIPLSIPLRSYSRNLFFVPPQPPLSNTTIHRISTRTRFRIK